MTAAKKKLLIFHPVLATYRVDQFNSLNEIFDLTVIFLFDNMWNYKMDQQRLIDQCKFKHDYLLKGLRLKGRVFRFGIYNVIKRMNPDTIISYEYSPTTQYLILLKKLGLIRQNIGISTDDSLDFCHNVQSKLRYVIRNQSIRNLSFLVVLSKEVSDFYKEYFKLDDSQVIISPILQNAGKLRANAGSLEEKAEANVENFGLRQKKVLLFVGRLIPEKALPQFLRSIGNILAEKDDSALIIVGEGNEMESLKKEVGEMKLEEKVIFTGKLEGEHVYSWYLSASGLVLPSISEAFGAVVNEALIFGLPVLCSKYAGATSLINSSNGMVFDPLNESDTASKTRSFIEKIKPVEKTCLTDKPSLMDDYSQQFHKEWEKLQNV